MKNMLKFSNSKKFEKKIEERIKLNNEGNSKM